MQIELQNKAKYYLNYSTKISKPNILKLNNMDAFVLNITHMDED